MSPESADATSEPQSAAPSPAAASSKLPKVQLDIDDAPFLQEAEPEAPVPAPLPEDPASRTGADDEAAQAAAEARKKKKKKIIIAAGAGFALLLAGGAALWWFVLRTPPPPAAAPQVVVVSKQDDKGTAAPSEFYINFEPFWLELVGGATTPDKDNVFLLVCKFTAVTSGEVTLQEAQNKVIVLRDALYFYLKNKDYNFLTDPHNTPTIKKDLVSVLNGYLGTGKVDDVLFESYLGR